MIQAHVGLLLQREEPCAPDILISNKLNNKNK
jgi:hypothetical protein